MLNWIEASQFCCSYQTKMRVKHAFSSQFALNNVAKVSYIKSSYSLTTIAFYLGFLSSSLEEFENEDGSQLQCTRIHPTPDHLFIGSRWGQHHCCWRLRRLAFWLQLHRLGSPKQPLLHKWYIRWALSVRLSFKKIGINYIYLHDFFNFWIIR